MSAYYVIGVLDLVGKQKQGRIRQYIAHYTANVKLINATQCSVYTLDKPIILCQEVTMNEAEEAIITGMDVNTTWMFVPKVPKRIKCESTKDKKAIDINIKP